MKTVAQAAAGLTNFLDGLRQAGFTVGVDQFVAAEELLLNLAARGALPDDPRRLATLIGPIVCKSPRDQEVFRERFDRWIEGDPARPQGPLARSLDGEPASRRVDDARWEAPPRWRWSSSVAPVLALFLALTGVVLVYHGLPTRRTPVGLTGAMKPQSRPVTTPTIETGKGTDNEPKREASANTKASDLVDPKSPPVPKPSPVPVDSEPVPAPPPVPVDSESRRGPKSESRPAGRAPMETRTSSEPEKKADDAAKVRDKPNPAEPPRPTPSNAPERQASPKPNAWLAVVGVGVTILGGLFLFWLLRRQREDRMVLQRGGIAGPPELARLTMRRVDQRLYQGGRLPDTVRDLRRRRPVTGRGLDVVATVGATVQRAGWFTPIPPRRLASPEYLVLVDRSSYRDHQARLADALLQALRAEELPFTHYFFDHDPRVCQHAGPGHDVATLHDLAGRYPDHRLILIGDGDALIGPLTGAVVPWADQFEHWPERALLTPDPATHRGGHGPMLAEAGWVVLPAGVEGLGTLADLLNREPTAWDDPAPELPDLPATLTDRPRRWLERREPGEAETRLLLDGLRESLGADGFRWLAACAVYPEIHWDLTLYLGTALSTSRGDRLLSASRLAALVRLPWFRHGTMPDWLRTRLLDALSPEQEAAVRATLEALFLTALDHPGDGFALEVAPTPNAQRLARRLLRLAPHGDPLRDHVFASVLRGRRPDRLAVGLPAAVTALLSRRAPLRTAVALAGVTALLLLVPMLVSRFNTGDSVKSPVTPLSRSEILPVPGQEPSDNVLGMVFCWCPPGPFRMGSPPDERGRSDDEGPVDVTMTRGFWLGKYEVTQEQWQKVMGTSLAEQNSKSESRGIFGEGPTYPMYHVNHAEAEDFCRKLTASERAAGRLPAGWECRLPTEAEWEYACRAGSAAPYSFGSDPAKLGEYAWFDANSGFRTHPVGTKRPNAFGLHDMHGNVWEWCRDGYDAKLAGGMDPVGPLEAPSHVLRGGCWRNTAGFVRSGLRSRDLPVYRYYYLGFRVARVQSVPLSQDR